MNLLFIQEEGRGVACVQIHYEQTCITLPQSETNWTSIQAKF